MSNDLKYCTCGCGQALGADPRAKYASGACRVRAHRRRNVTSVTPGERDITPTSDPLHDPLHNPSVTFVTGDTLYTPELYEDGSSYGDLPKGLLWFNQNGHLDKGGKIDRGGVQ